MPGLRRKHRYRWVMVATCTRCQMPASVLMTFSYDDRAVWLEDLTGLASSGYYLCAEHGDRLTPPLGWTLTDLRSAGRLFVPLEVA